MAVGKWEPRVLGGIPKRGGKVVFGTFPRSVFSTAPAVLSRFTVRSNCKEKIRLTKTESDVVVVGPSGKKLFRDASVLFNSVNQSIQEQYLDVYAPFQYRDEREKNQKEHTFYTEISAMICEILNPQQSLAVLEGEGK